MLAYIHANLCMKTPTRDPRKEKINYKKICLFNKTTSNT